MLNNKILISMSLAIMLFFTVGVIALFSTVDKESEKSKDKSDAVTQKVEENDDIKHDKNTVHEQDFSAIDIKPVSEITVAQVTQQPQFDTVSFVAVGDNIVHGSVMSYAKELAEGTDKEYNFLPMFENVADIIQEADLAFINQESPFAGKERNYSGYPMFNSPDEVGFDLIEMGFDVINLANNHMLDRYAAGYQRTIDFWKNQEGVTYIGGFENREDYNNIRVIEKNGISIALLSYTYSTNGVKLDKGSEMVIPLCDAAGTSEVDRQTKIARTLADIVIVSMHWGNEDWFQPSDLQKKQMQIMVDNGVDVIIGTHPHVLEPMMWKERPDGGKTLVIYSLGNFLSGMLYVRNMVGGIAGFDLVKAGDKAFVTNAYLIPTVCHYDTYFRNFKVYRFSEYTEQMFDKHRTNLVSDTGRSYDYMRKIIDDAIPEEFLIEDFYKAS